MKNKSYEIASVIITLLTVARASGAGLINGDFETPTVTVGAGYSVAPAGFGWTIATGNIELLSSAYWQPSSGNQSIDLNGSTTGGFIRTLISADHRLGRSNSTCRQTLICLRRATVMGRVLKTCGWTSAR